jgi:hypothetical protein
MDKISLEFVQLNNNRIFLWNFDDLSFEHEIHKFHLIEMN